jgi:hypothetical protein
VSIGGRILPGQVIMRGFVVGILNTVFMLFLTLAWIFARRNTSVLCKFVTLDINTKIDQGLVWLKFRPRVGDPWKALKGAKGKARSIQNFP